MVFLGMVGLLLLEMGVSLFGAVLFVMGLYYLGGFFWGLWEVSILIFATLWVGVHQLRTWPARKAERARRGAAVTRARSNLDEIAVMQQKEREYKEKYGRHWLEYYNRWVAKNGPKMTPQEEKVFEAEHDEYGIPYL